MELARANVGRFRECFPMLFLNQSRFMQFPHQLFSLNRNLCAHAFRPFNLCGRPFAFRHSSTKEKIKRKEGMILTFTCSFLFPVGFLVLLLGFQPLVLCKPTRGSVAFVPSAGFSSGFSPFGRFPFMFRVADNHFFAFHFLACIICWYFHFSTQLQVLKLEIVFILINITWGISHQWEKIG